MADIKTTYATPASITCTLASLSSGSARECTAVDNTTNLYLDAMVNIAVAVGAGTIAGDKSVYVWFYGSADGTDYTDNATGSDAAVTMRSPSNLRGPFVISTPTQSITYKACIGSVASFFGGVLPQKWGFVVENQSGIALSSTEGDHTKEYAGVYATSA